LIFNGVTDFTVVILGTYYN